jgi:quinol monooxygenase YgiN
MELYIFARFHARDGDEAAVAAALRDVVVPTRAEPGCLAIDAYRSIRDLRLFYLHSRWIDETAFNVHAELPHTLAFVQHVERFLDHPLDVARTTPLGRADQKL